MSLAARELDNAICHICQEYLTDPVTIECGHNFCQGCITQRCEGVETAACPQCGEMFQKRAFRPNTLLGSIIQSIKQVALKPEQKGREGNVCEEHGKELTWFCKKDSKALCEDCKGSLAHRSHAVIPMGMAAHESKREASTSSRSENVNVQEQETSSTQQQELRAMASAHPLRKLLEEVVCPTCRSYFKDPVSIDCGHNFCRVCITEHYEKMEMETEEVFCPQCRKNIKNENFQTNRQLARMVENIQQLGIKPEDPKKQIICREHEDKLKLFCEDDGEVICLVCDNTQEHRSHTLVPTEQAVQEYKVKLHKDIELLKKAVEEISKLESKEQNKPNDWKERVKCQRQRILSEFEKLQLLLNEEKELFLQRLAEEERETLKKLNENVTKLAQQSSSLQQLISEIQEKCLQPAMELLKDVKDTLIRSEQVRLQKPELSAAELKDAYGVPGMMEMLREFTVDVTLDPDTANPNLVLSEDRKRVRHRDTRQDLPDNPERFDLCPCVLGTEGFTGGRHYWEVEVGDKTDWDLGVCRETVSRKGKVTVTPRNGYWAIWLWNGEYKANNSPSTLLPVSVRPSRVGIFLDYEAGEVSFYNVTNKSHLLTIADTFSGMLRPYFSSYLNKEGKNSAPLIICPIPAHRLIDS
ncbi:E3 ubiquitin-protein ligase TRIM39-like isoform X1 [Malaclemys terrapin pileata]|uniref:E3 ubiquitin-protein ligase TRIM39-like isoform X1 n=2 Tax=Malaclemys terrapin pileata TaxID=2991368 RepID=UPI0023A82F43|nr:E3 ubiquitin-protein ligase TRIM39-like isoform X1 [Malaclemys terrapin pileata]